MFGGTPGEGQPSLESSPALSILAFSTPLKMWYSLGMAWDLHFNRTNWDEMGGQELPEF